MIIAFDVDNTLLVERDGHVVVNESVRDLMVAVYNLGLAKIIVWSGGGPEYAEYATRDCGIRHMVYQFWGKSSTTWKNGKPDISIDDQSVMLATVNLTLAGNATATPWMALSDIHEAHENGHDNDEDDLARWEDDGGA